VCDRRRRAVAEKSFWPQSTSWTVESQESNQFKYCAATVGGIISPQKKFIHTGCASCAVVISCSNMKIPTESAQYYICCFQVEFGEELYTIWLPNVCTKQDFQDTVVVNCGRRKHDIAPIFLKLMMPVPVRAIGTTVHIFLMFCTAKYHIRCEKRWTGA